MNDTVKLIVEVPKDYYEIIKLEVAAHLTDYYPFVVIGNGTLLDDVKAEIKEIILSHSGTGEEVIQAYADGAKEVLKILDNIGKAESEDKE